MNEAKRKRFLLDLPLQLRFTGFVLASLAASLCLVYLSVTRGLEQAARAEEVSFVPVEWARQALAAPFALCAILVLVASGAAALLWSHRVIGPLLVLTAGLRRVREGDLSGEVRLRDTDSLAELIKDFSEMREALRKIVTEDRRRMDHIQSRIADLQNRLPSGDGSAQELEAIRTELREITSLFRL